MLEHAWEDISGSPEFLRKCCNCLTSRQMVESGGSPFIPSAGPKTHEKRGSEPCGGRFDAPVGPLWAPVGPRGPPWAPVGPGRLSSASVVPRRLGPLWAPVVSHWAPVVSLWAPMVSHWAPVPPTRFYPPSGAFTNNENDNDNSPHQRCRAC